MNNEIIIDGVDVAECEHHCKSFDNCDGKDVDWCDTYENNCSPRDIGCNFFIKRLEQENARLKEKISQSECPFFFKHTAICLGRKDEMQRYEKCTSHYNCNIKKMAQENKTYKQALQETKGIATDWLNGVATETMCIQCKTAFEKCKTYVDIEGLRVDATRAKMKAKKYRNALEDIKVDFINHSARKGLTKFENEIFIKISEVLDAR